MARRPYERRDNEGPEAFEAFTIYRDMGLDRSLVRVAAQLSKSEQLMARWSGTHEWVKRIRAYDMEVDRRKHIGDLRGIEDMRRRQTKLAMQLQELGALELKKLLKRARSYDDAGVVDDTLMLKLIDAGSKLERVVRGEPGEIIQTTGNDAVDLTDVSIDDLKALKRIKAQVQARAAAAAEGEIDTVH